MNEAMRFDTQSMFEKMEFLILDYEHFMKSDRLRSTSTSLKGMPCSWYLLVFLSLLRLCWNLSLRDRLEQQSLSLTRTVVPNSICRRF